MKQSQQIKKKSVLFLCSILLFLVCSVKFWLAARGKAFWGDESDGIFWTIHTPWKKLLFTGMHGQASPNPLSYILDKLWLELWQNHPQKNWDLRIYLRILPATFWSLTCVSVFLYSYYFLRRIFLEVYSYSCLIISLSIALFYYQNSFMNIYAIETRAYSLWLFLTTLHTLFFFESLQKNLSMRQWCFYGVVCILLVFVTHVGAIQIGIGFALLLLKEFRSKKFAGIRNVIKPCAIILTLCFACALWYFSGLVKMHFGIPTYYLYYISVREVMLKSFHHHGVEPAFITFPLLTLLIPYLWRHKPAVFYMSLFCWLHILFSFVMFLVSRMKGGIYASRYAIYLIPSFSWFYLLGVCFLLLLIYRKLIIKLPQQIRLIQILTLIGMVQVLTRIPNIYKEIRNGLSAEPARKIYSHNKNSPECFQDLPQNPLELEKLNNACLFNQAQ